MAGEIGYLTLTQADAYFATRLASDAWTTIPADSNHVKKIAALTTAYDRLYYAGLLELPTYAESTIAQLVVLQKAQCELAFYMLIHLADEDRRKGLQAQGVTVAGIVKEQYGDGSGKAVDLNNLPFPPIVLAMLEEYAILDSQLFVSSIDRDEDEDAMKL